MARQARRGGVLLAMKLTPSWRQLRTERGSFKETVMDIFSVKATLWEIEQEAFKASVEAARGPDNKDSKAKASFWQFARGILLANQN